jgi:hypothetical protein
LKFRRAEQHISTSYVERQNLTMRMSMRRFTRLTNAFSKKVENHAAAVALYFMYYNFGREHQTLKSDAGNGSWDGDAPLVHRGNRWTTELRGAKMTKKRDSLDEYLRGVDLIRQEMADREEQQLLARLRAVPATDEEISSMRNGLRERAEKKGVTIAEAHAEADSILRFLLDHNQFLPGLDVRDDDDDISESESS